MNYLDEKQSTKVEKNRQSLVIVLIIFIALLSFLLGILTCMVFINKSESKKNDSQNLAENAEYLESPDAVGDVSKADLEEWKEELREELMEVLEEEKSVSLSKSTNNVKDDAKDDADESEKDDEKTDDLSDDEKTESKKKTDTDKDEDSDTQKTQKQSKHRYELIVEDISWTDAEKSCRDKGGYLATITTKEEFDVLTEQIENENKTGISFFIGATRDENYVKHTGGSIAYHWVHDGADINMYDADTKGFWLEDEPSFNGKRADGSEIEEMYVDMIYREAEKKCYFNDVANNVLDQIPGFAGSIGYICEYED